MRKAALERDLGRRQAEDLERVDAITEHMRRTLSDALREPGTGPAAPGPARPSPSAASSRLNRAAWRARLDGLDASETTSGLAIERRYLGVRALTFPVAVLLVTRPERLMTDGSGRAARRHGWLELLQQSGPFPHRPGRRPGLADGPARLSQRASGPKSGPQVAKLLATAGRSRAELAGVVFGDAPSSGATRSSKEPSLPASLTEVVPEHRVVLRPDFAFCAEDEPRTSRPKHPARSTEEVSEADDDDDDDDAEDQGAATPPRQA